MCVFRIVTHSDGSVLVEGDAAQLMSVAQSLITASGRCGETGRPAEQATEILDDDGVTPLTARCTAVARID